MEERDVAGSLLVTEVYIPPPATGPPIRRTAMTRTTFPAMTYLEETYYSFA